jgi:hypothetical protein
MVLRHQRTVDAGDGLGNGLLQAGVIFLMSSLLVDGANVRRAGDRLNRAN